ncbi:MAG: thioesterase family protein [Proteobacteria bacterium]|nr:thioesterase family protein [Pseudomonadota bacterium]
MPAPLTAPQKKVEAAWIDYNGHMNMAYYNLVFDNCVDHIYDELGVGVEYVQTQGGSCFTLEVHVNYLQELSLDDPIRVTFQLLDWDAKRLHFFQSMYHATKGYLAATSEQLAMHVDMESRRSAAFPDEIQMKLEKLMLEHAGLDRPKQVGRSIGIPRKNQ